MTTRNMFQIASMTAVFASASFGQTPLKATVNFPFVAEGKVMASGTYRVVSARSLGGKAVYFVTNNETRKSIMVSARVIEQAKLGSAPAHKLVFHCDQEKSCHLTQIWDGNPNYAIVKFPAAANASGDEYIEVAMTKSDPRGL